MSVVMKLQNEQQNSNSGSQRETEDRGFSTAPWETNILLAVMLLIENSQYLHKSVYNIVNCR